MNAFEIQNDLNKALALVARKHGIAFASELGSNTDGIVQFSVTMGDSLTPDKREYLAAATNEMKAGHNCYKSKKPGLCDDMLGKRFSLFGKSYIYLGCISKRPRYPVSVLCVKHGSYQQLKCPASFLDSMIAEHLRVTQKERHKEVEAGLRKVQPDLAEEASF